MNKLKLIVVIIFSLSILKTGYCLQPKSIFGEIKDIHSFLSRNDHKNQSVQTIIVFGSNDTNIVRVAYNTFKKSIKNSDNKINLIFTGGIFSDTIKLYQNRYITSKMFSKLIIFLPHLHYMKKLFTGNVQNFRVRTRGFSEGIAGATNRYLTEADIFADMFLDYAKKDGMDLSDFNICTQNKLNPGKHNIILERSSINTNDNCIKTNLIIQKYGLELGNVILIQKPLVQLRAYLSAQKNIQGFTSLFNVTYQKMFSINELYKEILEIIRFNKIGIIATPNIDIYQYKIILAVL